ncbi:MAG: hypothetical protein CMM07_08250 [Rhodopirellula sp.]|nr:hypothetical protein [Rhodopirellula sp.]
MSNAWGRSVSVLVFTAVCVIAAAQEKTQEAKGNSERGITSESREMVKGRLPRYFASLVNSEQRIEIYLIQSKFRDQISELKQQLEKLEAKQMQDIEAVLTADQRDKLFDFRNNSRKKRSKEPASSERRNPTQPEKDSANQTSNMSNK